MLFGRDNGHYPTFDLFKAYYAIVDNYPTEIQSISDEIYVTDKYNLLVDCLLYTSFPFSHLSIELVYSACSTCRLLSRAYVKLALTEYEK